MHSRNTSSSFVLTTKTGFTNLQIEEIAIFDLNGKKVFQNQEPVSKIDISNLEVGMYFIKFKVDNMFFTKRIIKK